MSTPSAEPKPRMRFPVLVLMNLLPRTWRAGGREGMIENRPLLTIFTHVILLIGVAIIALPVYVTFVASTLGPDEVLRAPMSLIPGSHMIENYANVITQGSSGNVTTAPVGHMMFNSLVTALIIAFGKITISLLLRVRGRVLPLPLPCAGVLADLRHADAARSRCGSCPRTRSCPTCTCSTRTRA
jgi:hypothetical protein